MPKADLDALEYEARAAETMGYDKGARVFRDAIIELRCARAEIKAWREYHEGDEPNLVSYGKHVHDAWKRLKTAKAAYDALGPAEETETKG